MWKYVLLRLAGVILLAMGLAAAPSNNALASGTTSNNQFITTVNPAVTPTPTPKPASTPTPSPKPKVSPTPSTKPAGNATGAPLIALVFGPLTISPLEAEPGENVTISQSVQNPGNPNGTTFTVILFINDAAESTKDITLAAGKSENITFTVSREDPGQYKVDVGGQVSAFTVKGEDVQAVSSGEGWWQPIYQWGLIGVGVTGIIVFAGWWFWWRRRGWIY